MAWDDKRSVLKIFFWLVSFFAALFFLSNHRAFTVNPFENTEFFMVSAAKMDTDGYLYVIDNGPNRITKLDMDGRIVFYMESGEGFTNARDLTIGTEFLYVHDVTWRLDGLNLQSERIVAFNKNNGAYIGSLFEIEYTDATRRAEPRLRALEWLDGNLWFVSMDEYGFSVKYLDGYGTSHTYHRQLFDNASWVLQDFSITQNEVYVLDKAGEIMVLRSGELSDFHVATSGDEISLFSLPLQISKDGVLFYADIGQRSIAAIDMGLSREFISPDLSMDYSQRKIFYTVDAANGFVVFSGPGDVFIANHQGEIVAEMSFAIPGSGLLRHRVMVFAAFVIVVLSLFYFLVMAALNLRKLKMTQMQTISLVVIIVALLVSVSIVPDTLSSIEEESRAEIINRLFVYTHLSQQILDTEAFENIRNPQDFNSEYFERLSNSLRSMFNNADERDANIYSLLYRFQGDNVFPIAFRDGFFGAFHSYGDVMEGSDIEAVIQSGGLFVVNDNIVDINGVFMAVVGPVFNRYGEIIGGIETGINLNAFNEAMAGRIRFLLVNIVLAIALLIFLIIEGIDALHNFVSKKAIKQEFANFMVPVPYIRALGFVIAIAFNLITGFLPIYAARFNAEIWGVSPEITAALPLSVNQVLIALAALLCGRVMRQIGMKKTFFVGAAFCIAGQIINAVAPTFIVFTAGMALAGFGAGLVFSFMNIYIGSLENVEHKTTGFSLYTSATFAGVNCGILLGAILAVTIGQAEVFYVSALVWVLVLSLFGFLSFRSMPDNTAKVDVEINFKQLISFKRVQWFLVIFLVYTTLNGFLFYFVPVFATEQGFMETEISLLFILHMVGLVLFGPQIAKKLEEKRFDHTMILASAMTLSIIALLVVAYNPNMTFVIISVFILGCSNSLGFIYFPLFFSEMGETKIYGTDKAMSIYGAVDNVGGAIGPFAFAWAITAGIGVGFTVLSAVSAVVVFKFYKIANRRKKKRERKGLQHEQFIS